MRRKYAAGGTPFGWTVVPEKQRAGLQPPFQEARVEGRHLVRNSLSYNSLQAVGVSGPRLMGKAPAD